MQGKHKDQSYINIRDGAKKTVGDLKFNFSVGRGLWLFLFLSSRKRRRRTILIFHYYFVGGGGCDRHDITAILLTVALNTINQTNQPNQG
jgi:hypothetical protein